MASVPSLRQFQLTGFSKEDRVHIRTLISSLGGACFECESFKPVTTHLLCARPTRSEKFLGSCILGIWILRTQYLYDCIAKGTWLDEAPYEWKADEKYEQVAPAWLYDAPHRRRLAVTRQKQTIFHSWRAAIVSGNAEKTAGYKRLLEIGGAEVIVAALPIEARQLCDGVTHVFISSSMVSSMSSLLRCQPARCYRPEYIAEYVLKGAPVDVAALRIATRATSRDAPLVARAPPRLGQEAAAHVDPKLGNVVVLLKDVMAARDASRPGSAGDKSRTPPPRPLAEAQRIVNPQREASAKPATPSGTYLLHWNPATARRETTRLPSRPLAAGNGGPEVVVRRRRGRPPRDRGAPTAGGQDIRRFFASGSRPRSAAVTGQDAATISESASRGSVLALSRASDDGAGHGVTTTTGRRARAGRVVACPCDASPRRRGRPSTSIRPSRQQQRPPGLTASRDAGPSMAPTTAAGTDAVAGDGGEMSRRVPAATDSARRHGDANVAGKSRGRREIGARGSTDAAQRGTLQSPHGRERESPRGSREGATVAPQESATDRLSPMLAMLQRYSRLHQQQNCTRFSLGPPAKPLLPYNYQEESNVRKEVEPYTPAKVAMVESCLDEECWAAASDLILTFLSSSSHPPSSLLRVTMRRILQEAGDAHSSLRAYRTLLHVLDMHPPVTATLVDVYTQSLAPTDTSPPESCGEPHWSFMLSVVRACVVLSDGIVTKLAHENNLRLLTYLTQLLETNFLVAAGTSAPMFERLLWRSSSESGSVNRRIRDLLQVYADACSCARHTRTQLEVLRLIGKLVAMAAECCIRTDNARVQQQQQHHQATRRGVGTRAMHFARELVTMLHHAIPSSQHTVMQRALASIECLWVRANAADMLAERYRRQHKGGFNQKRKSDLTDSSSVERCPPPERGVETRLIIKRSAEGLWCASDVSEAKRKCVNVNKRNWKGETPLQRACMRGDVAAVDELLSRPDVDVNAQDNAGWTALHEACNHGNARCVARLLDYARDHPGSGGVDVSAVSAEGVTPLHDAIINNHLSITRLLLKHAGSLLERSEMAGMARCRALARSEEMRALLDDYIVNNDDIVNYDDDDDNVTQMTIDGRASESSCMKDVNCRRIS
ncbi:PREDICTED: uncharacterized protein LOC106816778 [Priapulus caudatus]|uniref:Uncharacterized protein LOC106816778 n=1 Tax=Priapulus caudatus TaxID=37621 RepID=A0ABM1EXG7_PRICU|nr:PREDICTED: uncharacterized protein LOC106816778 [Priapulus caudatus]